MRRVKRERIWSRKVPVRHTWTGGILLGSGHGNRRFNSIIWNIRRVRTLIWRGVVSRETRISIKKYVFIENCISRNDTLFRVNIINSKSFMLRVDT